MNWKSWVPLVLAIVLGVVAAKVARDAMLKNSSAGARDGRTIKIVVAKTDIQPGRELTAADLTFTQMQSTSAPSNGFTDVNQLAGRVSETLIVKGQSVLEPMLAPLGAGSGLQALVPPGMRAITVEVNEFSGVAGMLTPGCRVDILATISEGSNGSQIAKTIVQNVKVTAVGQRTATGTNEPAPPVQEMVKSVTVIASLADAEAIELACSTGRPRLVLRGGRDQDITETAGITLGELRGSSGKIDPFVMPPVTPTTAPVATTKPVVEPTETPGDAVVQRGPHRRTIKLIKGGVESSVTLSILEAAPENDSYGTTDPTDPFGGN